MTYRILAILTCSSRIGIVQVTSVIVYEVPGPIITGLPRRRAEDGELVHSTLDVEAVQLDREH